MPAIRGQMRQLDVFKPEELNPSNGDPGPTVSLLAVQQTQSSAEFPHQLLGLLKREGARVAMQLSRNVQPHSQVTFGRGIALIEPSQIKASTGCIAIALVNEPMGTDLALPIARLYGDEEGDRAHGLLPFNEQLAPVIQPGRSFEQAVLRIGPHHLRAGL